MAPGLALIVGGNPLPNFVAALALKMSGRVDAQVYLLATNEVRAAADALVTRLGHCGFTCEIVPVHDAADASESRQVGRDLPPGTHLHYSGGTNTMAVHVHKGWQDNGGRSSDASYLYGAKDQLICDDAGVIPLDAIDLDLTTLGALHGLTNVTSRDAQASYPTPEDAGTVAKAAMNDATLASRLSRAAGLCWNKFSVVPKDFGLQLSPGDTIPAPGTPRDARLTWWRFFAKYEWLEQWVHAVVIGSGGAGPARTYVGVEACIHNRPFEVDVLALRGHRLNLISCTTDSDVRMCKLKLFEAALRARQIGGDLSRPALVCFGEARTVTDLTSDGHSFSGTIPLPRVFGIEHLKRWAGIGQKPVTNDLQNWLLNGA